MPISLPSCLLKKTEIRCGGKLIDLASPVVMGIMNVTPDSFYAESRSFTEAVMEQRAEQILSEGARIIDIGAYSSRPGADHIDEEEEYQRLKSGIAVVRKYSNDIPISVDTFRAGIIRRLVGKYGELIANDISGGELDSNMFSTVAELKLPYILMHMQGTPQTMQSNPTYSDVIGQVIGYFTEKISRLNELGVVDIVLDPGFGFGKTLDHNYELLSRMEDLQVFGLPLLVGVSRKSMLYKLLNIEPQKALNATTVVNTISLMKGANILRVHDVWAAVEAVTIYTKLCEQQDERSC